MATDPILAGGIRTKGRSFHKYEPIVSTTVFHWFTSETGNLWGPWPPFGGRDTWTGEPDWWKDQLKQMMLANFDVIYIHLMERFEQQRINLFRAYADLRAEGYDPPKIAPFLDPFGIWPPNPIDVATRAGKDAFAGQYIRFFQQYFQTNTDPCAESYLARIEDRLLLSTWWVVHILSNLECLKRADLEERLRTAFPAHKGVFSNGVWMASTALIEPDLSFSDERAVMFSGLHYCVQSTHNGVRSYHLQAGYWDQNIRRPGLFMPRCGGNIYRNVWDYVAEIAAPDVHRIYVESWNEYDEGSGIYAANPAAPYRTESNQTGNIDTWSLHDDPFEYIRTTHEGSSRINKQPWLDAKILGFECPPSCARLGTIPMRFCVRNQGNAIWTAEDGIGFGMIEGGPLGATESTGLNNPENEIDRFGGIFRGRPVIFSGNIVAPAKPGIYATKWSMFRDGNGVRNWFGETIEVMISVL